MNRNKLKTAAIIAAFAGAMYAMNRSVPKVADDYIFSFIWDGKRGGNFAYGSLKLKRVRRIKDLIRSQVSHYLTWSGRTIGETMNQLILMRDDKRLYDVLNTAAIMTQVFLCFLAAGGNIKKQGKELTPCLAALLCGGYYLCTPHIVVTSFWTTGAMNYSWPGLFQSAFLLPYSKEIRGEKVRISKAMMAFLGILAGWSNEAGGGMSLLLSGASAFFSVMKKEASDWKTAGLIGCAAGYALLMLAPGNFKRLKAEEEFYDSYTPDPLDPGSLPPEYDYSLQMFIHHLRNGFTSTFLRLLPLQLPVAEYLLQDGKKDPVIKKYLGVLEAAALSVPSILMLSPQFPKRAAYFSGPLMLTAAATAYLNTSEKRSRFSPLFRTLYTIFGLEAAISYISALVNNSDFFVQCKEQNSIMQNGKKDETVTVPDVMISPFWSRLAKDRSTDEYIKSVIRYEEDPDDPYNKAAAAYYGVKKVKVRVPLNHPYAKKDKKSKRLQIMRPIRNFFKLFFPGKSRI